jgi:hypothetical protein
MPSKAIKRLRRSDAIGRLRAKQEPPVKKLIILIIAVAIGLMILLSTLLADGAEALRAWLNGEEFGWRRRRQVWDRTAVGQGSTIPSDSRNLHPVDN